MGIFQKISKHAIHPLMLWQANELGRLRYLSEFEKTQYYSANRIKELQGQRLEKLLNHAFDHTEFYRNRLAEIGYRRDPEDVFSILRKLPPTEKHEIQQFADKMIASQFRKSDLIQNQTGGSTGQPVKFYLDASRYESRRAAAMRHDRWAGHDIGCSAAYIWGAPQDLPSRNWKARLRKRLLGGQIWLDTSSVTNQKMIEFDQQLKKFRPRTIIAYANAVLMLARFLSENKIDAYQPNAIITSAELLTEDARQIIEDVFGCRVFNRYGSREVAVLASECHHHQGMHMMAETLIIEIIDDQTGLETDQTGSILVTDLLNYAMPMIRYRIGDAASFLKGQCDCGRQLPRLQSIDGRVTDFLVGDSGQFVSGVFLATYVVAFRPSLGQVQMVQDDPGQVLFKVKPGEDFDRDQDFAYLVETAKQHLGQSAVVDIEIVDEIAKTPTGKMQFSISRATPTFARAGDQSG